MKYLIFLFSVFIGLSITGYSSIKKPMLFENPSISDGEMLKYAYYENGEKAADIYLVYKHETNAVWGDVMKVYQFSSSLKKPEKLPLKLTAFTGYYTISIKNSSLVEEYMNFSNMIETDHLKGTYLYSMKMNSERNQIEYQQKMWNGKQSTESRTRIKIKPEYPIWDGNSIAFIGSRFLDLNSTGMAYLVEPTMLKDPMPFTARNVLNETVETPLMGKFKAGKYCGQITDAFIGKLVDSIMSKTFMWVEDSPRRLVVKTQNFQGGVLYLDSISSYKGK